MGNKCYHFDWKRPLLAHKDVGMAGQSRTVARERDHMALRCPSVDTVFVTSSCRQPKKPKNEKKRIGCETYH